MGKPQLKLVTSDNLAEDAHGFDDRLAGKLTADIIRIADELETGFEQ